MELSCPMCDSRSLEQVLREVACAVCNGDGEDNHGVFCKACDGTGEMPSLNF